MYEEHFGNLENLVILKTASLGSFTAYTVECVNEYIVEH